MVVYHCKGRNESGLCILCVSAVLPDACNWYVSIPASRSIPTTVILYYLLLLLKINLIKLPSILLRSLLNQVAVAVDVDVEVLVEL